MTNFYILRILNPKLHEMVTKMTQYENIMFKLKNNLICMIYF